MPLKFSMLSADAIVKSLGKYALRRFSKYVSTEGLSYELSYDGTHYICTGIDNATSPDIVIAETVNGILVTEIGESAFEDWSSIESVIIPGSVTKIGDYAFGGCFGLEHIDIPDSVVVIGDYAFENCYNVRNFRIGKDSRLTRIGERAFYGCDSLHSITIPDSVTSIGENAFTYHEYSVASVKYVGKWAVGHLRDSLDGDTLYICEGTVGIADSAFYRESFTYYIDIPDTVKYIGNRAFAECHSLQGIHIPGNIMTIGEEAFYNCDYAMSITVDAGVKRIGNNAFKNCYFTVGVYIEDLTAWCNIVFENAASNPTYQGNMINVGDDYNTQKLVIPDTVTSIPNYAFYRCMYIESVTIPNSVTRIGDDAFYKCTSITEYNFTNATSVPELTNSNAIAVGENTSIIVPEALYNEWITATNWSMLRRYIVSDKTKSVPNQANFNIYVDANTLKEIVDHPGMFGKKPARGVGKSEVLYDGEVPFIRMYGDGSSAEAYAQVMNIEGKTTGKYLSFAYRLPAGNPEPHTYFQIFANTTGSAPSGQGDFFELSANKNDRWHIIVVDIAEAIATNSDVYNGTYSSQFNANADGTYDIGVLRIDFFNQVTSVDSYIDVAYVGICDSIDLARSADPDYSGAEFDAVALAQSTSHKNVFNTSTGLEYTTFSGNTGSLTEQYIELRNSKTMLSNGSRYVGVLYRNAPSGFAECYSSSTNVVSWYPSKTKIHYGTSDDWQFDVIELHDNNKDSVCRRFRLDYINGVPKNTEYNMDIAFVKFFGSAGEAYKYYKAVCDEYGLIYHTGSLEFGYPDEYEHSIYTVLGRGNYVSSTIIVPEYHNGIRVGRIYRNAFYGDKGLDTLILPESDVYICGYSLQESSIRVIKNYSSSESFAMIDLTLEYISILDGVNLTNDNFSYMAGSPIYDFSRHTSVAELSSTEFITVGPDTKIVVPDNLYDEWIVATNWVEYADHICKSSEFDGEY